MRWKRWKHLWWEKFFYIDDLTKVIPVSSINYCYLPRVLSIINWLDYQVLLFVSNPSIVTCFEYQETVTCFEYQTILPVSNIKHHYLLQIPYLFRISSIVTYFKYQALLVISNTKYYYLFRIPFATIYFEY